MTEATHLLARVPKGAAHCLEFILRGGAAVVQGGRRRLERTHELLIKYADTPMDYADATLVALAEELATDHVFTLDRRGFLTYRWGGRRAFRLRP